MTVAALNRSRSVSSLEVMEAFGLGKTLIPTEFLGGSLSTRSREATTAASKGFEETLFDALVSLKVSIAKYSMHLSSARRAHLFAQLDDVLNVGDWYEEDVLPRGESFLDLLKWCIYSHIFEWDSFGVSDDGNTLIAWYSDALTLTANFDGKRHVKWTARVATKGEPEHAAGICSLQHFAIQANFYLDRFKDGEQTDRR